MRFVVWATLLLVSPAVSAAETEELLVRLDQTAARYRQQARGFSCEETKFHDYRTRLKRRRDPTPKRVEPGDFGVPAYLRSAYFWVFLFRKERWPFHHYEIVGEEELFDRPAVVLRFEPVPPYRPGINEWFGTAWIDRDTAQPLKIVAHGPEDEVEFRKMRLHVCAWARTIRPAGKTSAGSPAKLSRLPLFPRRGDARSALEDARFLGLISQK